MSKLDDFKRICEAKQTIVNAKIEEYEQLLREQEKYLKSCSAPNHSKLNLRKLRFEDICPVCKDTSLDEEVVRTGNSGGDTNWYDIILSCKFCLYKFAVRR
jgi:DNA repair exonuclease SbcCD ATPase subunit